MPTSPLDDFLPRTPAPEIQVVLENLAGRIEELVNFGTRVFEWHSNACSGRSDEVAPIGLLLRHILEQLDAIAELIRESVVTPATLQLRSVLEASLQLEWILSGDSVRRGMAFMVWHVNERIKLYEKHDPSTEAGKQLASQLAGTMFDEIYTSSEFDLQTARKRLREVLHTLRYKEAATEYSRLRSRKKRALKWYELFDGPSSLEGLAKELGRNVEYEVLYRQWSGLSHATDIVTGRMLGKKGETRILQLRYPVGVEHVFTFAVTFALRAFRAVLRDCDPPKLNELRSWYLDEMQQAYREVSSRTLFKDPDT
jgi:hypothetical protein